jgi:phosphate transport system protein
MQRHFDQELEQLKEKLLTMASHAETAVVKSVQALAQRSDALAEEVKSNEKILDQFEVDIDELCIELLALKAPVATDLRLITVAMKASQNLERVGDESTTIVRRALELNKMEPLATTIDLTLMGNLANQMLKDALDAFVNGNTAKAKEIVLRDKEVDALNKKYHLELVQMMIGSPQSITRCLHLMVASKCLERIADHATNIAEEVVYLFEGRDIRHTKNNTPKVS